MRCSRRSHTSTRQADHVCVIASAKRTEKNSGSGEKLAFPSVVRSLFYIACRNIYVYKTQVFEESSRGGF